MATSSFDVSQARSPRYPRYSLKPAIDYARRLYDGAHRSAVDTVTAYRVMGFAGKSGASATALGAIRQFGLVEAVKGGGVRISELGLTALEPSNNEERLAALHTAANKPEIFDAIMGLFHGDPPRSDEPIRSFLIRSKGFSKVGADECIASFRETFQYLVSLEDTRSSDAPMSEVAPALVTTAQSPPKTEVQRTSRMPASEVIRMPLSKNCVAELTFEGEMSAEALERLIRHIELMKEVWVTD